MTIPITNDEYPIWQRTLFALIFIPLSLVAMVAAAPVVLISKLVLSRSVYSRILRDISVQLESQLGIATGITETNGNTNNDINSTAETASGSTNSSASFVNSPISLGKKSYRKRKSKSPIPPKGPTTNQHSFHDEYLHDEKEDHELGTVKLRRNMRRSASLPHKQKTKQRKNDDHHNNEHDHDLTRQKLKQRHSSGMLTLGGTRESRSTSEPESRSDVDGPKQASEASAACTRRRRLWEKTKSKVKESSRSSVKNCSRS